MKVPQKAFLYILLLYFVYHLINAHVALYTSQNPIFTEVKLLLSGNLIATLIIVYIILDIGIMVEKYSENKKCCAYDNKKRKSGE